MGVQIAWNFLLLVTISLPCSTYGAAYYEVIGPDGSKSIKPFFHEPSTYNWATISGVAIGGAVAALIVILAIVFCCGSSGGHFEHENLSRNAELEEEEPVKKIAAAGKPVAVIKDTEKKESKRARRNVRAP